MSKLNIQKQNMKTKIFSLMAFAAMTLGLVSCHEDLTPTPDSNDEGQVNMFSMAVEINNAEKVITSSRASIDLSNFIVEINNAAGQTVQTSKYGDLPEILTLSAGNYSVRVRSHNVNKAAWEEPYFVGTKDFTITKGEITDIGVVVCKLSNIKVSIRFSDELVKHMGDDCKVTVVANDAGRLEFTKDETRSGYFEALEGSSTLVAQFSGTVGGHYETFNHVCNDVEAGQHRIITFKVKTPSGEEPSGGSIIVDPDNIAIDASTVNVNLNGNINLEEEILDDSDRPGQEEGGDEPGPDPDPEPENDITMTCVGADFDKTDNSPNVSTCVVTINTPQGARNLVVTINSTSTDFLGSLSELTPPMPTTFDLANPGENREILEGFGFPLGNDVIGKTAIEFNISQFVPLLNTLPGTHSFTISVTDQKAQQLVKTLTFKAELR